MSPEAEAPGTSTTGTTATDEEPAPPETPPPSPRHGEVVEGLRSALGERFVQHHYSGREAWVRVAPEGWREAARISRDRFGLSYLCFISGIDWKQAPEMGAEKRWDPDAEPAVSPADGPGRWVTGVAGGDTRFQVLARLYDVVRHVGLTLKADAGDGPAEGGGSAPRAESWVPLFRGADWHERETWEMYGIEFDGHPGLRHLYLPGEFEGHPLRKDFPLLAREVKPWPGLVNVEGLPGEESESTDQESPEGAESSEGAEA